MLRILTIFLLLCAPVLQSCQQDTPKKPVVISSIKPVHALVYAVAGGAQSPLQLEQLLPDGASPHHYALKPSDRQRLDHASVVFYISDGLETFLEKPLTSRANLATAIALAHTTGLQHLPTRQPHETATHNTGQDLHLWLNPINANRMAQRIATVLGDIDPIHREDYLRNAAQLQQRIQTTDAQIQRQLAAVKNKPYLAFHDAWQHFDNHYGLAFAGAVTLDISRLPGARHVQEIRRLIQEKQVVCLFQEPQFPPALVKTLAEGTDLRIGELDPLGMRLPLTEDTYTRLLQDAADSFQQCLMGTTAPSP